MASYLRAAVLALIAFTLCGCAGLLRPSTEEPPGEAVSAAENAPPPGPYRLGAGDILSIRIYDWRANNTGQPGEDDLRIERIRLDNPGVVSLPFGDFQATGKTMKEFESAIVESLRGRLLRNPRVWVNIDEYRAFYVEGQVGRPGAYPYQLGLNVRKAITIGGGMKERASAQKMFVVREGDAAHRRIKVNMSTPIGPGDTLTVEESFF